MPIFKVKIVLKREAILQQQDSDQKKNSDKCDQKKMKYGKVFFWAQFREGKKPQIYDKGDESGRQYQRRTFSKLLFTGVDAKVQQLSPERFRIFKSNGFQTNSSCRLHIFGIIVDKDTSMGVELIPLDQDMIDPV